MFIFKGKKFWFIMILFCFSSIFAYAGSVNWIGYIESGSPFEAVFDQSYKKFDDSGFISGAGQDPMGNLKGGESYKVVYNNGSFACTGYNEGMNTIGTWNYSNAKPSDNLISLWGRPFVFDGQGRLYDTHFGLVGHLKKGSDSDSPPGVTQPGSKTIFLPSSYSNGVNRWFDSGMDIKKGSRLSLIANGVWRLGTGPRECNADGLSNFPPYNGYLYGTLMGKIGTQGTPFPIGTQYNAIATASGRLFLANNDSNSGDNSGQLKVSVSIR